MTTILEELSGKKLASATVLFLVALAGFFIAGGVGPSPTSSHMLLFRGCALRRGKLKAKQSLENPVDRSNCPHHVDHLTTEVDKSLQGDSIVYYAKLPLDRGHVVMSRWFQWIGSSFHIDLQTPPDKDRSLTVGFSARLWYANSVDVVNKNSDNEKYSWKRFTKSIINFQRDIECSTTSHGCSDAPFFELMSSHHKYYLINMVHGTGLGQNKVGDIWFSVVHWRPAFIRIIFSIKTVLTPVLLVAVIWFGKKIFGQGRQSWPIERLIFCLGLSLILLNFPIDWVSLWFDAPWLSLWADIRQGLFYCMLTIFWLIFVCEQFYGEDRVTSLKSYRFFLIPIVLTSAAILAYGLVERGSIINNPFFTYWGKTSTSYTLWAFFMLLSCVCFLYVVALVVLIALTFRRIRRQAEMMQKGSVAQLRHQGRAYRLKFLLAATLLTIVLTGVSYVTHSFNEAEWKHIDGEKSVEISGALYTGVYGLWNLYALAVMILYSPGKSKVEDDGHSTGESSLLVKADESHKRKTIPGNDSL